MKKLIPLAFTVLLSACEEDRPVYDILIDQLAGKGCKYFVSKDLSEYAKNDYAANVPYQGKPTTISIYKDLVCKELKVSPFSWGQDENRCKQWAVACLGIRNETAAVPVLIQALVTTPNYYNGDGVIPIRTEVVSVLGWLGDERAIKPLEDYIASHPKAINYPDSTARSTIDEPTVYAEKAIAAIKERNNKP